MINTTIYKPVVVTSRVTQVGSTGKVQRPDNVQNYIGSVIAKNEVDSALY